MQLKFFCLLLLVAFALANQQVVLNVHQDDPVNPNCEKKSWLTALLLSIFLGGTGADQFYLGWITDGVAKLLLFMALFCWGYSCGILNMIIRCVTAVGENKSGSPLAGLIVGCFGSLGACCCSMALFAYCLANIIMIATRFQKPFGCAYTDDK